MDAVGLYLFAFIFFVSYLMSGATTLASTIGSKPVEVPLQGLAIRDAADFTQVFFERKSKG